VIYCIRLINGPGARRNARPWLVLLSAIMLAGLWVSPWLVGGTLAVVWLLWTVARMRGAA